MEYRKEKSEHSKELIRKHFQSDILNISTGYYKTEKLLPVTPKPNESRDNMKEFVPQYNMLKPNVRQVSDLMSHKQKFDLSFQHFVPPLKRQNSEVNVLRNYTRTIKDSCYDDKGNFSAKKRFRLEFFGKENVNYIDKKKLNRSFSQTIKDKRKNSIGKFSHYYNYAPFYLPKTSRLMERIRSSKNIKNIYSTEKNHNLKNIPKTPRKKSTNDIINYNFKSPEPENNSKKNKTNINFIKFDDDKIDKIKSPHHNNTKYKSQGKIYYSKPKNFNKEFYSKTNQPIKSSVASIMAKDTDEKDYFDIEIKNENNKKGPNVDQKKLKQIFLKNGLHLFDFNEDGMNNLFNDKKIEAKLRKNKRDENFDKNYRNVVKELNKINVVVNCNGMIKDTGFINKNAQRKRKGTPGKNLYKNKENKNENNKLNSAFVVKKEKSIVPTGENRKNIANKNFGFKRDKNIMPQENKEYKNGYNYKMNYYNHKRK